MKTIAATLIALGLIAGTAQARVGTYFDQLNQTAPRSVFDSLQDSAPRSVFDQIRETAPRSLFDQLNDSAPRSVPGGSALPNDLAGE